MLKEMRADGPDRGADCRQAARQAPARSIRDGMAEDVDRWLDGPEGRGGGDRRNGLLAALPLVHPGIPARFRYPTPRRAQAGVHDERHRKTLPGGPAKDTAHGHLPGPHIHGTRPLRHLSYQNKNDRTAAPFTVTHKS